MGNFQKLQEQLGYTFQDESYLHLALTHPSASGKNSKPNEDNQRMEFLGDAILQVVISEALYSMHLNYDEGALTKARAGLVNGSSLANKASLLGLENHLIIGRGQQTEFERGKSSALEDAFEAIIAAIFLDGGLDAARVFLKRMFKQELANPDLIEAVMATAAFMGLEELYAIGGAQSIAALAYGTESIKKVVKITGPGNAYVAEAKRQLYGIVGIDSLAGPSEIMIVSDRQDIPVDYIVRDMLSQAEHDPDAGAFLVTTSENQAKKVAERIKKLVPKLPRKEIIEASFSNRSAIILAKDLEEIFEIINEFAPEHLEILTKKPFEDLYKIRNAGAIFLGPNTPEPVGDYFAGPNHTLPTSGCAKFSSPLGVQDFVKTSSVISYSAERLQSQGEQIIRFAEEEELFSHAAAIQARLDYL